MMITSKSVACLTLAASLGAGAATTVVNQEGVAGVPWLTPLDSATTMLQGRLSDECQEIESIGGRAFGDATRRVNQQIGELCEVVKFDGSLGGAALQFDAHFDNERRLVRAIGRSEQANSLRAALLMCRERSASLSSAYGEGTVQTATDVKTGAQFTSVEWRTRATRIRLNCTLNADQDQGRVNVAIEYLPWSLKLSARAR